MDSNRVNRSELVGKAQNDTAVLEALIRANALNRTGNLNYNENGKLDGVGFEKVSEKFIDNFVFCNIVPDYNTKKIKGKKPTNMFVASQYKTIRDLLAVNGFIKPNVKAIRSWTPSKIHWFFSFYIEIFKSLVDKEVNIGQRTACLLRSQVCSL